MVWNYHDEDKQSSPEEITINVSGLPATTIQVSEYRIDQEHSNSYEVWKKMGSPQNPTPEQVDLLEKSGNLQLTGKPEDIKVKTTAKIVIRLPRQGVSMLKLTW